jgi:hypothetical protein
MLSCHAMGAAQLTQADRGFTNDAPRDLRSRTKPPNEASEAPNTTPIIVNSRNKTLFVIASIKLRNVGTQRRMHIGAVEGRFNTRRQLHGCGMFLLESAMIQRVLIRSLLGTSIALSACSGGGGGGGATAPSQFPPPVISFNHVFPAGDATAAHGVAWDIVAVKTTLSERFGDGAGQLYDTLVVEVMFTQDISQALPSPGSVLLQGSQLGVGISFDTDNNSATGSFDSCDVGSNVTPFEYVSDAGLQYGRLADGNYTIASSGGPIYSGGSNPPEEAVTSVSGHVLTQSFYLPALHVAGGSSIPRIGLDVAALNGIAGVTDCVPVGNGELYTDHQ